MAINFGFGSFNFSTGEFDYLFKKGNSLMENIGFGLGAIANAQDILVGFNPGNAQIQTENTTNAVDGKDNIGHFQVLDEKGNSLIDYGPKFRGTAEYFDFVDGRNNWVNYSTKGGTSQTINISGNLHRTPINIKGVNLNRLTSISNKLNSNPGSYNFLLRSCSSVGSRALMASGYLALGGIHPYLIRASVILREAGLRPSLFGYFFD